MVGNLDTSNKLKEGVPGALLAALLVIDGEKYKPLQYWIFNL